MLICLSFSNHHAKLSSVFWFLAIKCGAFMLWAQTRPGVAPHRPHERGEEHPREHNMWRRPLCCKHCTPTVQHTTRDYLGSRGRFKRIMKMLFSNTNNYFMVNGDGQGVGCWDWEMSHVICHVSCVMRSYCLLLYVFCSWWSFGCNRLYYSWNKNQELVIHFIVSGDQRFSD